MCKAYSLQFGNRVKRIRSRVCCDSDVHRQNEECQHIPTKEPHVNKIDDSLVDEVEHVLLFVDLCH